MKTNKQISLIIPQLFSTELFSSAKSASVFKQVTFPDMPSFSQLFTKARLATINQHNPSFPYLSLFPELSEVIANNQNFAMTNLSFSYHDFDADKKAYQWIYRVNPVHLHPDMKQLILSADLSDDVSDDEANSLVKLINHFFNQSEQDKSWELVYQGKNHYYLLSTKQILWENKAIFVACSEVVSKELATGQGSAYWNQAITEIQMLLFSCAINEQRNDQRQTTINSLWIWGGEKIDAQAAAKDILQQDNQKRLIVSDNLYAKQLADALQIPRQSTVNKSLARLLNEEDSAEQIIIFYEKFEQAVKAQDLLQIIDVLAEYEANIFQPVLELLRQGKLEKLEVVTDKAFKIEITKKDLPHWWQRKKHPLALFQQLSK